MAEGGKNRRVNVGMASATLFMSAKRKFLLPLHPRGCSGNEHSINCAE